MLEAVFLTSEGQLFYLPIYFMKTISLDSQSFTMVAPESDADLAELIPLITPAYKRVFGDAIWREGWKCSICKKSFAFSDPLCENGQCCG